MNVKCFWDINPVFSNISFGLLYFYTNKVVFKDHKCLFQYCLTAILYFVFLT